MKAAPARSMLRTKNPYHHNVPALSSSWSLFRGPSHITGTVTMTGTKMTTRCKNLKPVATGSISQTSKNAHTALRHRFECCSASGT